jgi:hypothetical protein
MTDFEDQLRRALQRKEPGEDFAARVAARARRPGSWFQWRTWAAAGIAASLFVGAFRADLERRDRVRREGEDAREQLLQAMQITSAQLDKIHKKVRDVSR